MLLLGARGYAQNAPDPQGPPPQAFDQMRSQMEAIHRTERQQILAALTPEHRTLLATIAGQLATSATPDYDGAATRFNAALSPAESQAVLRASENARAQERSLMQRAMSQFSGPRAPGSFRRPAPDAGHVVMRLMMGGPMIRFMGPPHPPR